MTNVQPAFHVRAIDLLQRARDIHRETCILARGEVRPTAYRCGMCEVLNPPAAAPAVVEPPADDPMFGGDGCTCIPFTRQTNPPRRLKPTDTVDMISGWERGQDCPHHASAVPSSDQAALRDRLAEILRAHANLGGAPLKYALPFFDGATPSLPRISGWKPLDDVVDDLAAAVLPEPADRAVVLREAADWFEANYSATQMDGRQVAILLRDRADADEELRRMADETATETTQPARCVCGHPIGLHHEDVCLRTDCGCADALEINAVPEALEAVLTERYTELGNSFSRMRRQEQSPDGWPAERPVGPHHVAETLRELLRRAATDGPVLRLPDHTVNEEETPPPAPRDRHRAAWNALTPQQQAAYLAQLDSAGARQDQTTTDEPERCAHCTHPKRDHDGRADHRAKHSPLVAGDPWCHACDGPCDYAAGARQDGATQ